MSTLFRNATLVQFAPARVRAGDLRQDNGRLTDIDDTLVADAADEVVDCAGAVLMPGLVNGHTHLYSALAPGMPAPPTVPRTFHEILKFIWWRLDRAHTHQSVEASAAVGAMNALHCGCTTLIDHHASPSCIEGSLDALQRGIDTAGCRGVLCYEITDRNGADGARRGLDENERYIPAARQCDAHRFAGLVGAHASFTLGDESLSTCIDAARRLRVGVHIHAAEDPIDERLTRELHGCGLLERFERHGMLREPGTIIAHGTHFSDADIAALNDRTGAVTIAHAPRSNMNNAVGYTRAAAFDPRPILGTDGIDGDMLAEATTAYFKSRDGGAPLTPDDILTMLAGSARRASDALGIRLGVLETGAAADLIVTDYRPASPLDTESLAAHVLFAMGSQHVRHVMVGGVWRIRDGRFIDLDEPDTRRRSTAIARGLHERMAELPGR